MYLTLYYYILLTYFIGGIIWKKMFGCVFKYVGIRDQTSTLFSN